VLRELEETGRVVGVEPGESVDAEVVGDDDEGDETEEPDPGVHGERGQCFASERAQAAPDDGQAPSTARRTSSRVTRGCGGRAGSRTATGSGRSRLGTTRRA